MPQGIVGTNIGPTEYCTIASFQPYVSAATLIPLVNDTLVFLAISWRLMRNAHAENSLGTKFRTLAFAIIFLAFLRHSCKTGKPITCEFSIFACFPDLQLSRFGIP